MAYSEATVRFFVWRAINLPVHESTTPRFHYDIIERYTSTPRYGFGLLQVFRGGAKTQLSMEFALYCICEGIEAYVLFVGATQELSNEIVNSAADLAGGVKGITVTRSVDGILEIINTRGSHAFLVAKSTGSKLRGIAKSGSGGQRQRPTCVILDDLVAEDILLGVAALKIHRAIAWLSGALFPTLDPSSSGKVFGTGTPIKVGDPYMKLTEEFGCVKIPLTEDIWPDRFSAEFIAAKKEQAVKLGQMRSWKREYELVLVDDETKVFNMDKVGFCELDDVELDKYEWVITLDGAFGGDGSDRSAICALGLSAKGEYMVYIDSSQLLPQMVIKRLFELQKMFTAHRIGIEKGAFKNSMEYEIGKQMEATGQYFRIEPLHTRGSKISRILALEPLVNGAGVTCIDWDTQDDSALERLIEQMELTSRDGCAARNDDEIDAFCGNLQLLPYTKAAIMTPKVEVVPRVLPMLEG